MFVIVAWNTDESGPVRSSIVTWLLARLETITVDGKSVSQGYSGSSTSRWMVGWGMR